MERRLVIGMTGVVVTTLIALFASASVDASACPPTIGGAGCARFSVAPSVHPNG